MGLLKPQVLEATGFTKEHAEACAVILRLGGVVYIPCGEAPHPQQLIDYELAMPGTRWTYMGPMALHGPLRMYGKHRVRIELQEGAH